MKDTMFCFEYIKKCHFYNSMVLLLSMLCDDYNVFVEFSDKYMEYENVNMHDIPESKIKQMYKEYEKILEKKET